MEQVKKDSINIFFETVEKLRQEGIIRSTKYLGDIAEYLCQELYGLTLNHSQRTPGSDATDSNNKTYQIKINNSSEKTNQDIGDITTYDILLLIVTSNSLLFDIAHENAFMLIYKIPSNELTGNSVAKTILRGLQPDKKLDRNLNIIA